MSSCWVGRIGGLILMTGFAISQSISEILPEEVFRIQDPQGNCTQRPYLPCNITVFNNECPVDTKIYSTWPGSPINFDVKYTMEPQADGLCVARLHATWGTPYDASVKALQGFSLIFMAASQDYAGLKNCVFYDLSHANWTEHDISDTVTYKYSGIVVPPGLKFYLILDSRPFPALSLDDNPETDKHLQRAVNIPKYYNDGGVCRPAKKTTLPEGHQTSPMTRTSSPPSGLDPRMAPVESSSGIMQSWTKYKTGIVVGVCVGSGVIVLIILVVIRPWRQKHSGNTLEEDLDDSRSVNSFNYGPQHTSQSHVRNATRGQGHMQVHPTGYPDYPQCHTQDGLQDYSPNYTQDHLQGHHNPVAQTPPTYTRPVHNMAPSRNVLIPPPPLSTVGSVVSQDPYDINNLAESECGSYVMDEAQRPLLTSNPEQSFIRPGPPSEVASELSIGSHAGRVNLPLRTRRV